VAAGLGEALYVALLGGRVGEGLVLGLLLALSGHAGDLFESWVKRRFHAKNSGSLIPGHGGVLDRIDSLLFAVPVCAILIVFAGLNPFAGA
jgi:phosphatidate cytidylyltransferase